MNNFTATMPGSDPGSVFKVVAGNAAGRVGFRYIGEDKYRIRVEPVNSELTIPGFERKSAKHLSTVVSSVDGLVGKLATAQQSLAVAAIA